MAKKLLNAAQEQWLIDNYCTKTNRELAEKLTQMVKKDNAHTIQRLRRLLPSLRDTPAQKSTLDMVIRLEKFSGFSEAYIIYAAKKLGCPSKCNALLSQNSKGKAYSTNLKKWRRMSIAVPCIKDFLRTMRVRDVKVIKVAEYALVKSYNDAIKAYNLNEGRMKGIYIDSQYIKDIKVMRLSARLNTDV